MARQFAMFLLFFCLAATAVIAGDAAATPLAPDNNPLAVVRAYDPGVIERLFASRQFHSLGLSEKDYAGALPDLGVTIKSLRSFSSNLGQVQGASLWYCLIQNGESLVSRSAAMGFDWRNAGRHAEEEEAFAWLKKNAFDADELHIAVSRTDNNAQRLAIAQNPETLKQILPGGKQQSGLQRDRWRKDFNTFISAENNAFAIWLNPRPLIGLASLGSGIQFGHALGRLGLNQPDSAVLEIIPEDHAGNIGFSLRLNNFLKQQWQPDGNPGLDIALRDDFLFAATLAKPAPLLKTLALDSNALILGNLDVSALMPEGVGFSLWRDNSGAIRWHLACLLSDKEKVRKQYPRLMTWLEIVADSPASGITLREGSLAQNELIHLETGYGSLVARLAEASSADRSLWLLLASQEKDLPDISAIRVTHDAPPSLIRWHINLDAAARTNTAATLAAWQKRFGIQRFSDNAILTTIPQEESGGIRFDNQALEIRSEQGLALWLAPVCLAFWQKMMQ